MYVYIFHENFGKYILKSGCAHCSGLYLEAIYSAWDPTTAKVTLKMAGLVCIYLHYNQPGLQWSVLTQTSNVYFYCLWERWLWLNSQAKPIHAKTINTTHINLFSMPAILQHTVTKQHLRSNLSMCSGRSGLKYKAAPFSLSRVSQSQDLSIIWFVVMTRVAFVPLHMSATAKVSGQLSTWGERCVFDAVWIRYALERWVTLSASAHPTASCPSAPTEGHRGARNPGGRGSGRGACLWRWKKGPWEGLLAGNRWVKYVCVSVRLSVVRDRKWWFTLLFTDCDTVHVQ